MGRRWTINGIQNTAAGRNLKKQKPAVDAAFLKCCEDEGLPRPSMEYKFHPNRNWRFDYFFEANGVKVALEIEGGIFLQSKRGKPGGHSSIEGILRDIEKYNAAATLGIFVYRVTPQDRYKKKVFRDLKKILGLAQTTTLQ